MKRDARLDRMKMNLSRGHNTPVKWINQEKNTILTKTRRWFEESSITMPPEGRNRRYIIEIKEWIRKHHLLPQMSMKSIFRRMVNQNCWKTNNEKDKLEVGF